MREHVKAILGIVTIMAMATSGCVSAEKTVEEQATDSVISEQSEQLTFVDSSTNFDKKVDNTEIKTRSAHDTTKRPALYKVSEMGIDKEQGVLLYDGVLNDTGADTLLRFKRVDGEELYFYLPAKEISRRGDMQGSERLDMFLSAVGQNVQDGWVVSVCDEPTTTAYKQVVIDNDVCLKVSGLSGERSSKVPWYVYNDTDEDVYLNNTDGNGILLCAGEVQLYNMTVPIF